MSPKSKIKLFSFLKVKFNNLRQDVAWFYKNKIVYRLFWGRSNLYRRVIHFAVFSLTLTFIVFNFSSRIFSQQQKQNTIFSNSLTIGNSDLLEQGGNIETILLAPTTNNFQIFEYSVKSGDTYDSISSTYGITVESIKLSNLDKIDYYKDQPSEGVALRIPEINGILMKTEESDSLDSVVGKLLQGNRLDVIEINNLRGPDYDLPNDDYILIPDGLIRPPAPAIPVPIYIAPPPSIPIPSASEAVLAGVSFIDPLSDGSCGGYGYSRGFSSWHAGVDLTRGGGCIIRAAASGTVEYAGWASGGQGFMVRINHGNGVQTQYFHGSGDFYVVPGQGVNAGDAVMYMGCTGYCTGTHLHLTMLYNGVLIDPAPFVPFWRP